MSREAWQQFICAPERAGRHLANIGQSVVGAMGDAVDLAVLQAFLERLRGAADDIVLLSTVVDLLVGGYEDFLRHSMPRLLDALSNEVLAREVIVGPGLRGNPVWDRTIIGHMSGTLPPGRFIARTAHRSFDLPENRMLAWFMSDVQDAVEQVERMVGTTALHPSLRTILKACNVIRRHHWFADIAKPPRLTPEMTTAAKRQRRPEYRNGANLAIRRNNLSTRDESRWWYHVLSLLAVGWLEPIKDDQLFELYVLVLVLDIIGEELAFGDPTEVGLVTSGRKHVARFEKGDVQVKVFFDQSPANIFSVATAYSDVLSRHSGVSGAARRPDIVITVDGEGATQIVFVEMKESTDGGYISDSIYKVFGYLYDFEEALRPLGELKCILVVPDGVEPRGRKEGVAALTIVSADDRTTFAAALTAALLPA